MLSTNSRKFFAKSAGGVPTLAETNSLTFPGSATRFTITNDIGALTLEGQARFAKLERTSREQRKEAEALGLTYSRIDAAKVEQANEATNTTAEALLRSRVPTPKKKRTRGPSVPAALGRYLSERAAALDRLPADERARLPLFGVPFAVKDNIDVAGVPTTLFDSNGFCIDV